MGALIGLMLGLGLMLVWRYGPWAPARPATGTQPRQRRTRLLTQAGVEVSPAQLVTVQVGSAVVAFLVVTVLTSTVSVAVCFGLFGWWAPVLVLRRLRDRRQVALRESWPEAIDNLASAVRAGMSLPEGLAALGQRGPVDLRAAFTRFGARHRANGRFDECLDALKCELADPVGDRVCETVRVAREVGGSDLGAVLRALSELLRADARTRAELETRQGWTVNAARLAVAAPWAVLLLLGTQSSTLRAYDSAGGTTLLAIGAGVCLIAYRLMIRIGRLPRDERVLQ